MAFRLPYRHLWLAGALACACASVALAAFGSGDLIPRKLLFGNPERTAPLLSPDGTRIAFTAPLDGVMNLWVAPVDDLASAKPVTAEKRRPVRQYRWAPNGSVLLYLQDQKGNENFHLYAVNLGTGATTDLTPWPNVRAEILASSYERPDHILVGLNNRDPRWHDVWIVDVNTGEAKLVLKNDGFSSFVADDELSVRIGVRPRPDGGNDYLLHDSGEWKPWLEVSPDDALTTEPLFFASGAGTLYLRDSRGRDKSALTRIEWPSRAASVVAQSGRSDIGHVIKDPQSREVLAWADEHERMSWKALKPELKADIAFLDKQTTGYWNLLSQSRDNNLWTLWVDNTGEPVRFALYDRKRRLLRTLFAARPALEGAPLPSMHSRVIRSRDGFDLVSYVVLPRSSDPDGNGVPEKPLPMVLMVHGGPWSRDSFAYSPPAAWLSNRGYAVLMVNFRGSTGFGKAFLNAGDRQWGARMQDDLADAVEWAVDAGVARRARVAVYGASYGGYAALAGLAFTPGTFACGVDVVGPSNLSTMLANVPPYWSSFRDALRRRVGDPGTPEGKKLLRERSPLFSASRIRRPLLIAHGANDPRTKKSESDQIVRAMNRRGLPVTYALYSDEGHGFARPENRLSFYAIAEQFLSRCLGGRAEALGGDLKGSSVTVPVGREHIEGLREALAAH